ncbi:MAG: threonine synthase, partial [Candidatus Odinarchaeota archaeon]|nr:threonine synthase [Candidatus Odinarchaeota archaeon]
MKKERILCLKCIKCGTEYPSDEILSFCEKCGSSLDYILDYDVIADIVNKELLARRSFNMWRYKEFLPVVDESKIVSIGEGGTPLIRSEKLAEELGLKFLYLKLDCCNPTGSFKDRGASAAISRALELGVKTIVGYSTGNAGVAQAAYAARAGLESVIFVHKTASLGKLVQAMLHGSLVVRVDGTFEDAANLAKQCSKEFGWMFNGGVVNPARHHGKKTIAYEICEQLSWNVPDMYIQSVGVGTASIGAYKGFKEFYDLGWINEIPRIVCVQAEGCAPMVDAFKNNREEVVPVKDPKTVASAIAVGNPAGWPLLRKAVLETNGIVDSVSDDEILKAEKLLAKLEGIFAEPAAAAPIALLKNLRENGEIDKDTRVVCMISGHGLKALKTATELVGEIPQIPPVFEEFKKYY